MSDTSIYDMMSTCRAVRRLRPDPIPDDVMNRVLRAATWAPSGGNRQAWRIIAIRDRALKTAIGAMYKEVWDGYAAAAKESGAQLSQAEREGLLRTLAAGDTLASNFGQTPVVAMVCFEPSVLAITDANLDRPSIVGGASVYPAVQNLLLACRTEGLGCVLTTLLCYREAEIKALLDIPDEWATCACVPIGYPVGSGHGPLNRRPAEELVYWDRWDGAK
ncbi:MAG: nitroreductase [Myxococcota bacterium]|jgi:nitroreductase